MKDDLEEQVQLDEEADEFYWDLDKILPDRDLPELGQLKAVTSYSSKRKPRTSEENFRSSFQKVPPRKSQDVFS